MEVVQVIAGLDQRDGGPSYSVPRLAAALTAGGIRNSVLSVANEVAGGHGQILGPALAYDTQAERFTGELAGPANALLERAYREPFTVPRITG